jgi:hypothetical protein
MRLIHNDIKLLEPIKAQKLTQTKPAFPILQPLPNPSFLLLC